MIREVKANEKRELEALAELDEALAARDEARKTLAEVFQFDKLSPEQRQEHLRQAALALGLTDADPKRTPPHDY